MLLFINDNLLQQEMKQVLVYTLANHDVLKMLWLFKEIKSINYKSVFRYVISIRLK